MKEVSRIYNLRVNGEKNPVTDAQNLHLTFSACCESKKNCEEDVRFEIAGFGERTGKTFRFSVDRGKMSADLMFGDRYERVNWWVEAYCRDTLLCRSEQAVFERGNGGKFSVGKWIECPGYTGRVPVFKKKFSVGKKIDKATLFITGLGYYVSYLNGVRTDSYYLKPLVSEYDERPLDGILCYAPRASGKRIYYNVFDVSGCIGQGDNELIVALGNGWYCHHEKEVEGNYSYGVPKTIFELKIEYADGESEYIGSDDTCDVVQTKREATLFRGEKIDFRENAGNLFMQAERVCKAKLCDPIPTGKPVASPQCGDVVANILQPAQIYRQESGMVLDFGKNHSGFLSLKMKGERGSLVRIIYGEEITPDRHVDHFSTSWGILVQTDEFILSGETDLFECEFTVHAFRYAEIIWEKPCECTEIVSKEVHSRIDRYSEFSCSEKMLNEISEMCVQTFVSNMHGGIPSDCPHRERRGYTGDGQVTCEAVMYSLQAEVFYRKWLQDILDAQDADTGFVPHTAPFSGGGGGPSWGYAVCEIPYRLYAWTGDKTVLRDALPHIQKWVDYLLARRNQDGLVDREEWGWCLGEWFCPDEVRIPAEFVNTCVLVRSIKMLQNIEKILNSSAESYAEELAEVVRSINRAYLDEDGNYCKNDQGANLFALDAGIVPLKFEQICWKNCLEYFRVGKKFHVDTGIFGSKILFRMLFERGEAETALCILFGKDYPSYGYMLKQGATTLWECWTEDFSPDYYTAEGELCKGYPVSHNHPMFGSVLSSIYRFVAGLDLDETGSTGIIRIRPYALRWISEAEARVNTVFGETWIGWKRNESVAEVRFFVPYGCSAELDVNAIPQEYRIDDKKSLRFGYGEHCILLSRKELVSDGIQGRNAGDQYANA